MATPLANLEPDNTTPSRKTRGEIKKIINQQKHHKLLNAQQ